MGVAVGNDAKAGYFLQHAATYCNTLHTQHYCNTLQHSGSDCNTQCSTLQHAATYTAKTKLMLTKAQTTTRCNTLQHTATHCNNMVTRLMPKKSLTITCGVQAMMVER